MGRLFLRRAHFFDFDEGYAVGPHVSVKAASVPNVFAHTLCTLGSDTGPPAGKALRAPRAPPAGSPRPAPFCLAGCGSFSLCTAKRWHGARHVRFAGQAAPRRHWWEEPSDLCCGMCSCGNCSRLSGGEAAHRALVHLENVDLQLSSATYSPGRRGTQHRPPASALGWEPGRGRQGPVRHGQPPAWALGAGGGLLTARPRPFRGSPLSLCPAKASSALG